MQPNLIVIGAQKCGTSALHYYLRQHPEIAMSKPKELNFFIEKRNWGQGVDWYSGHWEGSEPVRGEASPNYTAHPHFAGVPEKMHSVVPDAKLIFLVRDPVSRMVSQYVHNYTKRAEHRDIATTLLDESKTYLHRSRYMFQVEQFLPYFPRESFLILDSGDLRDDRMATLARIFRFLGVADDFTSKKYKEEKHRTADKERLSRFGAWSLNNLPRPLYNRMRRRLPLGKPVDRPVIEDSLQTELVERLKPDADRFREFSGESFENWSV
ncbi:MAG: sulfotransferase [Thermoleophilaceae bacterium]|nr:sulfotransferase [Thermoleophilaceae bacterium]